MRGGLNVVSKILYIIDTLEVGGAERSLLEIVRRLDRRRFKPVVCHVYRGDTLQTEFEDAGTSVISLNVAGKYDFLRAGARLTRVVRRERPSLLHTTLFRADQIGRFAGRCTNTPVVSSFVNTSYEPVRLVDNPHLSRWKLGVLRRLDAFTCRWVDRFHAVSGAVRDSNCRHLNITASRVKVIPRGRHLQQFEGPSDSSEQKVRHDLEVAEGSLLFLNVGRLIDQKGHRYLLEAMKRVAEVLPDARLAIAGEGWMRPELEQLTRRLGVEATVALLGRRDDVPRLLAAADVFVFPSLFEGLPGALVEAMIAGKPIVASDIAEIREIIEPNRSGLLVPPRDPETLAEAMIRLATNAQLRSTLSENASQIASLRFDIERVVRKMEEFYAEVIEEPNRRGVKKSKATNQPPAF